MTPIRVGPMANFVYLAVDESGEGMVVDSGWETEPVVEAVEKSGARVGLVVATHGHFDHVSTIGELSRRLGARSVAHEASTVDCDLRVADGEALKVGGTSVRVLHTPGHTDDSLCLYDGKSLFTGDTLFVGTIGRFDRANGGAMYRSLYEVILRLPETTMIFPGHDYGDVGSRTLGEELKANPFLMARDQRSFLSLFS